MKTMTLYTDGGVSLSPMNGEGRRESDFVRLVADDGMMLSNGERSATMVDVLKTDVSGWNEVPYVEPEEEPTIEDKAEALTRYANSITGADDHDLISAAETLIEQRIKEES